MGQRGVDAGRAATGPGEPAEKVFRAWPWLERKEAASLCVRLQRASPKDTNLAAACQRGLSAKTVAVPSLTDDVVTAFVESDGSRWLAVKRGADVRGSQLDLAATTSRVKELLHRRAVLEEKDDAQVVALLVGNLGWYLLRQPPWQNWGLLLLGIVSLQIGLGIAAPVQDSGAHSGTAAPAEALHRRVSCRAK